MYSHHTKHTYHAQFLRLSLGKWGTGRFHISFVRWWLLWRTVDFWNVSTPLLQDTVRKWLEIGWIFLFKKFLETLLIFSSFGRKLQLSLFSWYYTILWIIDLFFQPRVSVFPPYFGLFPLLEIRFQSLILFFDVLKIKVYFLVLFLVLVSLVKNLQHFLAHFVDNSLKLFLIRPHKVINEFPQSLMFLSQAAHTLSQMTSVA